MPVALGWKDTREIEQFLQVVCPNQRQHNCGSHWSQESCGSHWSSRSRGHAGHASPARHANCEEHMCGTRVMQVMGVTLVTQVRQVTRVNRVTKVAWITREALQPVWRVIICQPCCTWFCWLAGYDWGCLWSWAVPWFLFLFYVFISLQNYMGGRTSPIFYFYFFPPWSTELERKYKFFQFGLISI